MQANKKIDISQIKVIQAPLAGISDVVFRGLVRKYQSKCLMTTEMISSEMLCNNPNPRIIQFEDFEYPLAFQLVGHKIDKMTNAAKIIAPFASMIDINCGCPVKKVVVSGDGSAMMKTPELACEIVQSIKEATKLPVSAKFRLGWTHDEENFIEFGKALEKAGVCFVTLHARTRSQMYSGNANWNKIKLLKQELSIPVFANGDIKTIEDAKNCLELTKCDGISIGRGIMGDFSLPYRIEKYIEKGIVIPEPNLTQRIEMLKEHLKLEVQHMGEKNGIKFMRKFYNYYIASTRNASKYRSALVTLDKEEEILKILDEILSLHTENN
ncbi:MAG: tRNA dihydrouridine synthase DusB [Candidatus Gastranaerophilales bacterium]|nr:tRNA dihydrouridine synthase DusB [Candidatus Gastranaerophilales bacterium]